MMWFALALLALVVLWVFKPWWAYHRGFTGGLLDLFVVAWRCILGSIILLAAWLALALVVIATQ